MISVRVADQNDFRVVVLEAELFDVFADQRHVPLEIRIDEDVALRSTDQMNGEVSRADVI
jgi:hypothetical protein